MGRMRELYKRFNEACDEAGVVRYEDDGNIGGYAGFKRVAEGLLDGMTIIEARGRALESGVSLCDHNLTGNWDDWAACNIRAIILEHLCRLERRRRDGKRTRKLARELHTEDGDGGEKDDGCRMAGLHNGPTK